MIDVSHITNAYGDLKAVNDLSFRVEPGELVGRILDRTDVSALDPTDT